MSIFTIIGHLFTFGAMFWLVLYLFKSRKREYCSIEIKTGQICYRCKCHIKTLDYWNGDYKDSPKQLCTSCKRDDSLNEVMNKSPLKLNFDITDDKWSKRFLALNLVAVVFNVINLFIPGMNLIGGICLFIAQAFFYYRFMAITRKKTQSV